MSVRLEEQITNLFREIDSSQVPVTIGEITGDVHLRPLTRGPDLSRAWALGLAGAGVALIIGVLVLSRQPADDAPVISQPTLPPVTQPVTPPTTAGEASPEQSLGLAWLPADSPVSQPSHLLSDGSRLFIVDPGEVRSSVDGVNWDLIDFETDIMLATGDFDGGSIAAHDGEILTVHFAFGVGVEAFLLDTGSGTVTESTAESVGGASTLSSNSFVPKVAFGPAGALIFGFDNTALADGPGVAWQSPDGVTWTEISGVGPFAGDLVAMVANDGGFVAVARTDEGDPSPAESGYWVSDDGLTWKQVPWDTVDKPCCLAAFGSSAIAYQENAFVNPSISANPTWLLDGSGATLIDHGLPLLEGGVDGYGPALSASGLGIVSVFGQEPSPDVVVEGDSSQVTQYYEFSPDGVNWVRGKLPEEVKGINALGLGVAVTDTVAVFFGYIDELGTIGRLWVGSLP